MKTYSRKERRRIAEVERKNTIGYADSPKPIRETERRPIEPSAIDSRFVELGGPSGYPSHGSAIEEALDTFGIQGRPGKLGFTDGEVRDWPTIRGFLEIQVLPELTTEERAQFAKLSETAKSTDASKANRAKRMLLAFTDSSKVVKLFNNKLGQTLYARELRAIREAKEALRHRERLDNMVSEADKHRGKVEAERQLERRIGDGRVWQDTSKVRSDAGASLREKKSRRNNYSRYGIQRNETYTLIRPFGEQVKGAKVIRNIMIGGKRFTEWEAKFGDSRSASLETGVNLLEVIKAKAERSRRK